ncbi:MAG: hypothetical protein AAB887_01370 [Patescibacteria group bacterium]
MAREEVLRRRPCLLALPNFRRDLSAYVEAKEQAGESTKVVLVTYNRVGEGLLEPRTTKGRLTLDTYSGQLMMSITADQMLSLASEESELPSRLTAEQIADFLNQVRAELSRQILTLNEPTSYIVYAGEKEKFRIALDMVGKLSSLAAMAGKAALAKFYLLTCSCDLSEKTRMTEVLHCSGQVQTVVYNPAGVCGGLTDLQTIAETVLNAVPEK